MPTTKRELLLRKYIVCQARQEKAAYKLVFIGRDNWPVEGYANNPVRTFIRRLFKTKKIIFYYQWIMAGGCKINFK